MYVFWVLIGKENYEHLFAILSLTLALHSLSLSLRIHRQYSELMHVVTSKIVVDCELMSEQTSFLKQLSFVDLFLIVINKRF